MGSTNFGRTEWRFRPRKHLSPSSGSFLITDFIENKPRPCPTSKPAGRRADPKLPAPIALGNRLLAERFHRLADVPPEIEWFANIANASTRRAYETAIHDFTGFAGINRPEKLRAEPTFAESHGERRGCAA
jgi:hypothetical protein